MSAEASRVLEATTDLGASLGLHRWATIASAAVASGLLVALAFGAPSAPWRRWVASYVASLEAQQRWMHSAPNGAYLLRVQCVVGTGLVVAYTLSLIDVGELAFACALVALAPKVLLSLQTAKRRSILEQQSHGFGAALGNCLRSASNVGEALKYSVEVTPSPLRDEVLLALRHIQLGSTVEDSLLALSARAQSPSLDAVISALLIGRQTGGDLPRILETTAASLRELKRLEELTDKTLRDSKQGFALAVFMVVAMAIVLPKFVPEVFEPLRTTAKGQALVAQMVLMFAVAVVLAYRFTRKSV